VHKKKHQLQLVLRNLRIKLLKLLNCTETFFVGSLWIRRFLICFYAFAGRTRCRPQSPEVGLSAIEAQPIRSGSAFLPVGGSTAQGSMKNRSRGRKGDLEAREEWTARLNKFAAARSPKQKRAAIEPELKINPGGALRDMLHAWGYSASARGRKSHEAMARQGDAPRKTARERLEETLDDLFGKKPSPIPSLYTKLAGRKDVTVTDACRLVSAMIMTWPEPLRMAGGAKSGDAADKVTAQAEAFVRELLSELSDGRSREWTPHDIEIRAFRLVDEERIGLKHFIKEAGKNEGALIVAGARNILIGTHPVNIIRDFHNITNDFIQPNHKGILIFVMDSALFEAGAEGFTLLYNIGLLASAVTAFALFPPDYEYRYPIQQHRVDLNRWEMLRKKCCVVMRKPPIISPDNGDIYKSKDIDIFRKKWDFLEDFPKLDGLKGFVRFDAEHVLPREYPQNVNNKSDLFRAELYWDVIVRPKQNYNEGMNVQYFVPSAEVFSASIDAQQRGLADFQHSTDEATTRGRRATKYLPIEEDLNYVIRQASPGPRYDDAQTAIYMAARGRLNLDTDSQHDKNMNAAAALRELGFEVLPISTMIAFFPKMLELLSVTNITPYGDEESDGGGYMHKRG